MRNIKISVGEHYHIFNRGVNKQVIFHDIGDYTRFLFLILYFQLPEKIPHLSRAVKEFARSNSGQHSVLTTSAELNTESKKEDKKVELVAFCLMPNHFHLLLKENGEAGVSSYMQRVLNAYGKYYNTKYGKSGHVFQGPYKAVHVLDDTQLMYLSAYVHRNSRELSGWMGKEELYPWSSYRDYIKENRWSKLLSTGIVMERFDQRGKYKEFVESSVAKLSEEEWSTLGVDHVHPKR